ncbi:MAG: zinc ribbon domain-containing protein [Clostridia bacterium]|nr:zinc ribbon domain-containing protein [Clostridia bacterium]
MATCKHCGTENDDTAVFCKDCGKRVDGNTVCPTCGKMTEDDTFCIYCGNPLDGRKKCVRCGTLFEGFYCTECGLPAGGKKAVRDGRLRFPQKSRPRPDTSFTERDVAAEENLSAWKKILSLVLVCVALAAIVTVFVLTFFTGAVYEVTGYGLSVSGADMNTEKYTLFHFFGKAYSSIKEADIEGAVLASSYTISVLGTVVSAAMILVMTVMTVITVSKLVCRLMGRPVKHTERYVILTYFLYVAFVLVFRNLLAINTSVAGVNVTLDLNTASVVGLALGGSLVGVYFVGQIVIRGRALLETGGIAKIVPSAVCAAFLIVAVCLLSGATCGFTEEDSYFEYTYRYNYLYYTILSDAEGYEIYIYSFFAELLSIGFITLACLAISDLLSVAMGTGTVSQTTGRDIAAFVVGILLLAFAVVTVNKTCEEIELDMVGGHKNFGFLIAGFVLSSVSFIVSFVCGCYERIRRNDGEAVA